MRYPRIGTHEGRGWRGRYAHMADFFAAADEEAIYRRKWGNHFVQGELQSRVMRPEIELVCAPMPAHVTPHVAAHVGGCARRQRRAGAGDCSARDGSANPGGKLRECSEWRRHLLRGADWPDFPCRT